MSTLLRETQRGMCDAIAKGPDFVDRKTFRGSAERVDLGFVVHATTISYARLTTLEANFPRTREHLGPTAYDELALSYIESDAIADLTLETLGREFPEWLKTKGQTRSVVLKAEFERAILASSLAVEIPALDISALAGLSQDELLSLVVKGHPSLRVVAVDDAFADDIELDPCRHVVVIVRDPDHGPEVFSLSESQHDMVTASQRPTSVEELFAVIPDADECLACFVDLLSKGVFVLAFSEGDLR